MTGARLTMAGLGGRLGRLGGGFGKAFGGISAIGAKELRGRMRGRRAFAFLTFYLTVLSGFVWMLQSLQSQSIGQSGFGTATASAEIGTTVFIGLLMLETLLVLFLAPAFTAGAISQEREKQTLDLLAVTPISSLAIVLGKLFSALAWVFILVFASIPLTAIVFTYGGVAPEDLIRGYVVLTIEAIGLGAIGLFCSALLKRTLAATVVTYFIVLALTLGAGFVWIFLTATGAREQVTQLDGSTSTTPTPPPEFILWFNPFVADADVLCPTGTGYNGLCSFIAYMTGKPDLQAQMRNGIGPRPVPAVGGQMKVVQPDGSVIIQDVGGPVFQQGFAADVVPQVTRDVYWPRSAAAWIVLSVVLVLLSVNLVTPTRRWRPRLPRRSPPGPA